MSDEDKILTKVAVEAALGQLHPADREMLELVYRIVHPPEWKGRWPPRLADIGEYIGIKWEGAPLSEAAVRYRIAAIEGKWRGERGSLRRTPKTKAPKGKTSANLLRKCPPKSDLQVDTPKNARKSLMKPGKSAKKAKKR